MPSRNYELAFIISPEVSDSDTQGIVERVSQLVSTAGGEVTAVEPWGRRRLAYRISSFHEGSYILMKLRMEPTATAGLERNLALLEEVIRHLLVRLEGEESVNSVTKGERG